MHHLLKSPPVSRALQTPRAIGRNRGTPEILTVGSTSKILQTLGAILCKGLPGWNSLSLVSAARAPHPFSVHHVESTTIHEALGGV